jgi:micrococcal nuclease
VSCKDDGGDVRSADRVDDRTTTSVEGAPGATVAPGGTAPPGATAAPNGTVAPGGSGASTLPPGDDAVVDHIVDGDTLRTTSDERVRLLNIDTPEVDGRECWSGEATDVLESMIPPGTEIRLAYDVERLDRYGRTLAHVYRRADGLWVNLAMVEAGAARPYVLQPNDTLYAPIEAAASAARAAGDGLWGACGGPIDGVDSGTSNDRGTDGCDPSYPTVCIPSPPPDLDCADIPHRRFTVVPPDPHHFDGGGDGIGCENG